MGSLLAAHGWRAQPRLALPWTPGSPTVGGGGGRRTPGKLFRPRGKRSAARSLASSSRRHLVTQPADHAAPRARLPVGDAFGRAGARQRFDVRLHVLNGGDQQRDLGLVAVAHVERVANAVGKHPVLTDALAEQIVGLAV